MAANSRLGGWGAATLGCRHGGQALPPFRGPGCGRLNEAAGIRKSRSVQSSTAPAASQRCFSIRSLVADQAALRVADRLVMARVTHAIIVGSWLKVMAGTPSDRADDAARDRPAGIRHIDLRLPTNRDRTDWRSAIPIREMSGMIPLAGSDPGAGPGAAPGAAPGGRSVAVTPLPANSRAPRHRCAPR